jgi:hypothetical protein
MMRLISLIEDFMYEGSVSCTVSKKYHKISELFQVNGFSNEFEWSKNNLGQ